MRALRLRLRRTVGHGVGAPRRRRRRALALLVGGGIVCYFALAHLFGGMRITDLRRAVRR